MMLQTTDNRANKVMPLLLAAGSLLLLLSGFFLPPIQETTWHIMHNALVFAGVIIGFIIFFLTWFGTVRQNGVYVTIISLVMLWVSVLDAAHLLTSPLFNTITNSESIDSWNLYWLFSHLVWAIGLLYAVKTRLKGSTSSVMHKTVLVFAALLIIAFAANVYISTHIWSLTAFSGIITTLTSIIPYLAIMIQLFALVLLWLRARNHTAYCFLWQTAVFGILSDACFALALHQPTWLSLVAHIFRLVAYLFLLRSIYLLLIQSPYEEVQAIKNEMEALAANKEHLYQCSLSRCDLMEETLSKLGTLISSRLDLDDTYRAIADMVTDMMGAGQSCVTLTGENNSLLHVAASYGISNPPETMPFEGSLTGAAIIARKAQVINDLNERPDIFKPQLIFSNIQSVISAPLFDDQQIIGGVEAYASEKNAFTRHECLLLQALGRHAGAAIASARQYKETQLRLAEEQFLYQITQTAASTVDPDTILRQCLPVAIQALNANHGICFTCTDSYNLLFVKAVHNCHYDAKEVELGPNPELTGIIHSLTPEFINAASLAGYEAKASEDNKLLVLPLVVEHRALGLILLGWSKNQPQEGQRRLSFASLMAQQIALGLEKAQLYHKVKAMALSDGLTGLANRRNFDMFLEAELRRSASLNRPLSLIMLDLDRFKRYNDTYGHLTGDKLLAQIGKILREHTRKIDFPARYGGEEFSVILPECSNSEATAIADKIRQVIELSQFPDNQGGFSAKITASLGVATYNPQILPESPSKERFIAIADTALYRAKENGRNQVVNSTVLEV